jgi:hypothetical protein
VIRFDTRAEQVDVALDQDARFPRSGGGFEDDVLSGIDGRAPGVGIR